MNITTPLLRQNYILLSLEEIFKTMEIDYTSYGQCRCCLNKGRHRDIMKAYYYQGKREVYYEMFIECFNLYLVTETKASSLICESCINDLRHATAFKSKVSVAEHNILNTLHSLEHGNTVFVNVSETVHSTDKDDEVKPELDIKTEAEDDDGLMAVDIDECDGDDFLLEGAVKDIYLKEDLVPGEAEFLARFKPGSIKLLPTRSSLYDINPAFAKHMDALRGKYITLEMISKLLNTTTSKLSRMSNKKSFVSEKQALAANALAILTNSNVTPFRSKKRKGYPCFYCYTHFEDIRCMREHQLTTHKKTEAKIVLRHMTVETMSVYVDVTDLKCTICDKEIPNINELKSHLTKTHDKKMYLDHPDCVVPFKLGNQFLCQICNGSFQTFGSIERHMNVHFRNHVCHECGGGFLTKHRLKVHIKSMHADGYFPCVLCNKAFTSQQKTNNHVNSVHKSLKRFKCKMCPQRFKEYFRRQRHMVEDHGEAPLSYKCNVCDRSFERRYTLSRHMKRDHLDERDYQCDVCAYTCFTKNELRLHMIKHNGERIHECSVCKKSYARLKTLKEHMRIHNNDRRFSCAVCGQAFVQKCSLKGHIKTHHLEYSIEHNV